jgi:hypothetical protein
MPEAILISRAAFCYAPIQWKMNPEFANQKAKWEQGLCPSPTKLDASESYCPIGVVLAAPTDGTVPFEVW